jgi:pimeloyl-[acyl-carrier protein] synthase
MPSAAPIPGFEPESPAWREAFFRDPYPAYRALRAAGRPAWLPHAQAESRSAGVWLFARHAHAVEIFRDSGSFSKDISRVRPAGEGTPYDRQMLLRDGADHARLRRLVAPWFSDAALRDIEPVVRDCATALVARLAGRDACDLVADFAEPLPQAVIARFLGLPDDDLPTIRSCSLLFSSGFDSLLVAEPANRAARATGMTRFLAYLEQRIARAGELAPESPVRRLVAFRDEGAMTHDELVAMLGLLAFAGHETTISLLASGLFLLLSHPAQRALLASRPDLVDSAIEELLRYESPEQRTTFRTVVAPVAIDGHALVPGDQVGVVIGAANRDDTVFADAERFDITRDPNPHLAFGLGAHVCLGKGLARLEARVAIPLLLEACPRLALADHRPQWRRNSFFRALERLPVRLTTGRP